MTDPRRIAFFFATSGHSGVDRAVRHLAPAVAARGYQVDLLHVRRHGPVLEDPPGGVRVIDLGTAHVYSSLPAVVRYLRQAQPVVMLSDKDRVNRTALIARAFARVDTRAVVSTGTTVSIDLASRGPLDRWLQRMSMRHLYPAAYRVIVTSNGVADDMAAYTGLDRRHIESVPSPVITDAVLARAKEPLEHPWFHAGEPPVILGVGELCERKDFATVIRAFARVRKTRNCRLVIFGKGNQHEQLLALGRELGVAADMDLPGFEANPYRYMAAAAVFVLSSLWEGLGFVTIEALAVGTPVVCADCPSGPREILADGRYGPLVPVGDDAAMADALLATLDHPLPPTVLKEAAAPYEVEHATTAYLETMGLPPLYPGEIT